MDILNSLRFPFAAAFALLLNGTLFWTLWSLTNVEFELQKVEAVRIDFERTKADTELEVKRQEEVELEPPPVTPEVPQMSVATSSLDANVMNIAPTIDTGSAMTGIKLGGGSDRDVMPLVRIPPEYPPRALNRGLEGWVQVQFTITATGTVKDAVVVKSSNPIFEDAAIKAILRYRYNPKIENGEGVERVGIQQIIRFDLEG